jgi:hypothetical protein
MLHAHGDWQLASILYSIHDDHLQVWIVWVRRCALHHYSNIRIVVS